MPLTGDELVNDLPRHASITIPSFYRHDQSTNWIIFTNHSRQRIQKFRWTILYVSYFDLNSSSPIVCSILVLQKNKKFNHPFNYKVFHYIPSSYTFSIEVE